MKIIIHSIIITLLFAAISFANQYQVVKVIDGDTIDIIYQGKKERVRLLRVDTPESVHPDRSRNTEMGRRASAYTKSRLTGKYVGLEFEGKKRGRYGRLLAYVIVDGQNFNLELVQKGWSPYYTKYGKSDKYHTDFLAAEKEAKAKGLNIWSAQPTKQAPKIHSQYHGNTSSQKFHRPGCRYFNCKRCTAVFSSRNQAIKSGYSPCGICKP